MTMIGTLQIRILRLQQQPKNFSVRLSAICGTRIWVMSNASNLFNMNDWILQSELSHLVLIPQHAKLLFPLNHYPFRSWCRYIVMATSRSAHHRRQTEDYNEVPVISCDYGFFFADSRDDEERRLTEAEATAVGATPILVIRDKRSKMIHADCALQRN